MKLKMTISSLLVSLLLVLFASLPGYAMTLQETGKSITMPIQTWQMLKSELTALNQDLLICKDELNKAKKPSAELLKELEKAQALLKQLQTEYKEQKVELTRLFSEVDELRTSSQKLKEQINRERRIHKRQIWQNRLWFLLIGCGVGFASK